MRPNITKEAAPIKQAAMALLAAAPGLPSQADLKAELDDAIAAQARGYYAPDEDERLGNSYQRYLSVRAALWEVVVDLLPIVNGKAPASKEDFYRSYAIALCAASMLMRTGEFLVDMAQDRPVVWQKLDAAEPRYAIERKTFTALYAGLTSPKIIAKYRKSWRFYRRYKAQILSVMTGPLYGDIAALLEAEASQHRFKLADDIMGRLSYRGFSYKRRHISAARKTLFSIFEVSGSRIAALKQPFVKPRGAPKRVNDAVRAQVLELCQPGDVLVTRHDDALSNIFLPGYWPHAVLFLGNTEQRAKLGLPEIEAARHHHGERIVFMESKKDGVMFRPVEDTLELDAFVVLRPVISDTGRREAVTRAMSHVGKLYDFAFDFSSADKLACTELIYRAYHGADNINFTLTEIAGRKCLSAEDLMNQAIGGGWFDVHAAYGIDGDNWDHKAQARAKLAASFESVF